MDSIEIRKGLEELEPLEDFKRNPCEYTLFRISKNKHTPEMLEAIFNNPRPDDRGLLLLKIVSKRLVNRDVCEKAILRNPKNISLVPDEYCDDNLYIFMVDHHISLRYIPPKSMTKEMCEKAIRWKWTELQYVPPSLKIKKLCQCALEQSLAAIRFFPTRFITPELAIEAIQKSDYIVEQFKSSSNRWPISFLPSEIRTEEMVELSLSLFPESIEGLPSTFMNKQRIISVLERDGMLLKYIPEEFRHLKTVIKTAITQNPKALLYVPDKEASRKLCDSVYARIQNVEEFHDSIFPKEYREEYKSKYENAHPLLLTQPVQPVELYEETDETNIIQENQSSISVYNVSLAETNISQRIYYVSDLHLEHQLDLVNKPLSEIKKIIEGKVQELIEQVPDKECTLLIAGDISDDSQLMNLFCHELNRQWKGQIIDVLGNHELWDEHCEFPSSVDTIIENYINCCERKNLSVLENKLLLNYKGVKWATLSEAEILESTLEELRSICNKSIFLVLGGIGFSGCNPLCNANMGLYRNNLTREEEKSRSDRFRIIHDKLLSCISETRLVVLTHTPPEDWTTYGSLCPNWIYVSGHTHHNRFQFNENEPCILADNQIGYKRHKWNLKSFEYEMIMRYDPLAHLPDGIHEISAEQYKDFNRCSGILIYDFKRPGKIYALKRSGIYMFVHENRKIGILAGGGLRTASHTKQYYYDNMLLYVSQIKKLFSPYYHALSLISDGVKQIGGRGIIHGSIVDIDFYNHLFLDPYNGKVKPYFALNMVNKVFYNDIYQLIEQSPSMYNRELYLRRLGEEKNKLMKLLPSGKESTLAKVPEIVLDMEMYKPSRQMRAIQYVLEQNVIRIWRDEILTYHIPDDEFSSVIIEN